MDIKDIDPLSIIREARKNVPALKYAFGVLGLLAVLAVVTGIWRLDLRVAVFGPIVLIGLMTILVLFAQLSSLPKKIFQIPGVILLWFTLIVTMAAIVLLGVSVFFSWPLDLKHWLIASNVEQQSDSEEPLRSPSTGSTVAIEDNVAARALSVARRSPDQFYIGLTNPNEIKLMNRDGVLIDSGIRVPGEPALIIATDTQLFVATDFPPIILVMPRDLSTVSAAWDLPHDQRILEEHGKLDDIDTSLPSTIMSFAVTNDTIWVNAADNNGSVIFQVDRATGQWLIPEYYDSEMNFDGRDWTLHATSIGVVAFSTNTSPSSMYLLIEDEVQKFGGHEFDLVSSSTNVWIGKHGAVGVLDSADQMIEFDVHNRSLRQTARLGTLPARSVESVWDTVHGQWDNDVFWLALTETPIGNRCALWTKIYRAISGSVDVLAELREFTLKSFSVTGETALVVGQNCDGINAAYLVR